MAYKRKTWKNDSSTPLNADGLNDFDKRVGDEFDARKDYIIELGSNSYGTWEKWKSGKIVQTLDVSITLNTVAFQEFTTPITFSDIDYFCIISPYRSKSSGIDADWWDSIGSIIAVPRGKRTVSVLHRGRISPTYGRVRLRLIGK